MGKIYAILILSFVFFLNSKGQSSGDFRSKTGGSGVWSDYNAWERYNGTSWDAAAKGQVPTTTTAVEIKAGDFMIINTISLFSGNLIINGSLTYHATINSDLSVCGNLIVGPSGNFTSPSSGVLTSHILYIGGKSFTSTIGGNLTVEGVFNMNVFPTSGVAVSFVGTPNNSISGSGTINFYTLTVNKGTGNCNSVLEVLNPTIITIPTATSGLNRLIISNGTFKLSSALTLKPFFGSFTLCESSGKLWLNNSEAIIQSAGAGTVNPAGGTLNLSGKLQIDAGTFSFGAGNSIFNCNGDIVLGGEKAVLNVYGNLSLIDSSKFIMTNGNVNIYPQIEKTSVPETRPLFQFNGKSISFTGGTMTITDPNPNQGNDLAINIQSGSCNFSGSTICFGNGISDLEGTSNGFLINTGNNFLGNIVVNNSPTSTKLTRTVKLTKNSGIGGNLILNAGVANQFLLNGNTLTLKGNILNSGSFVSDDASTSGLILSGSNQQIISGNLALSTNIHNLTISNTSGVNPSVDLQIPMSVSNNLTLTNGTLGSSNNSVFTLGKSLASTALNINRSGGSFILMPTYALENVQSINVSYNSPNIVTSITTGNELPATSKISTFKVNNAGGVILDKGVRCSNLSLQSGNLITTSTKPIIVTGTTTTSINGGSSASYVNGPLTITIPNNASTANYRFPIGKNTFHLFEFSGITTGGIGTATFTVESFDGGTFPGIAGMGLSSIGTDKYWSLSSVPGSVTIASSNLKLTDPEITPVNRISQSNDFTGNYNSVGGIVNGTSTISSVNPIDYSNIGTSTYFRIGTAIGITPGVYAIGPNVSYAGYLGSFPTFAAAIKAVTSIPLSGNMIFEFQPDYKPSVEIYPIVLTSNIVTNSNATITFRAASNVSSVINFTGSSSIITNTGADYIVFDGRNGGSGTNSYFQFSSSSTILPVITLSGDVQYNQFLYSGIKGSTSQSFTGLFTITLSTMGNNSNSVDHCNFDGSGSANNCIYTSGISSDFTIINSNFYDFRNGGGINLAGVSNNAVIDNNNFYQTTVYKGFVGTTSGIIVASGNNVRISNNNIGGNGPGLTGVWTVSSVTPGAYNFTGIDATSLATTSKIYNNRIQNFDWKTNVSSWTGMNVSGSVNVGTDGSNFIGNNTGIDNIKITYFAVGASQLYGIKAGSTAIVENNIIGSITTILNQGITAAGVSFMGINNSGTGLVNNNLIGSKTLPLSINIAPESTGNTPQNVYGIYSSGSTVLITHNTIANINNGSKIAYGVTRGIFVSSGATSTFTFTDNDIHSLASAQPITGIGNSSSIDGINVQSNGAAIITITGNKIYDLINMSTTSVTVNGILFNSISTVIHKIERNYIHSFKTASNTAVQNGINLLDGYANVQNNVIRLGIDKDGNSITSTVQINGILKSSGTYNFYFNTIYIGGSGVISGNIKTYAFNMLTKTYLVEYMLNNIFVNARTNLVANKLNYAVSLPALTANSWNSDYNIYYTSATDGKLYVVNSADFVTLQDLRATNEGIDLHSGFGDPLLTHPAESLAIMDLRTRDYSPAEGTGIIIPGIYDDFAGEQRNSNSPTDIGAYSGNFKQSDSEHDIFSPVISYEKLGNGNSTLNRLTVNFASISDNGGSINVTTGLKPRLYFKLKSNANVFLGNTSADNGWKWVEATGLTSPFDFNIDYSILYGGPVAIKSVIQYFVVTQNNSATPSISFNPAKGAVGTSVAPEGMTAPTSPNSYTVVSSLPSLISVGTGQTYTTLTGNDGVFAALNSGSISYNTVVTIKSDLKEPGIVQLNQVSEDGPDAGRLTIKIQSDGSSHIISGKTVLSLSSMISFSGAKRVTIDGGTGKSLIFRNTRIDPSNAGAVIKFDNSSQYDTLTNCIIESNLSSTNFGAILILRTGSNIVTISNNDIRDARGDTIGSPLIGIYSNSANNALSIVNNNIYNQNRVGSYGMYLYKLADGCTIAGNSIYMEKGVTASGLFTGILVGYSNNHLISGNFIGGSAPACTGKEPFTISDMGTFTGICTSNMTTPEAVIQGNTIQNIKMASTATPVFKGINNLDGSIIITGNTIGSTIESNSIQIAGTGNSSGIINTNSEAKSLCSIEKNIIANVSLINATGAPTFSALQMNGGIIRKNSIFNIGSTSSTLKPVIYGLNSTKGNITNEFSNNVISLSGGEATDPSLYGYYDTSSYGTTDLYYNSINLYGTAAGISDSYAFYCANQQAYSCRNNVLVNVRSGGDGKHYAIYVIPKTGFVSDNNDLYVAGSTFGHFGSTGIENDYSDIVAWRKTSTLDGNSICENPMFTSQTNLIPMNSSAVIGLGLPVSNITTDIINVPRSLTSPSIGAYELVCISPTNGGSIAADQILWNSGIPALITSESPASGYSGKLEYKWQSEVYPFTTWIDIPTSNSSTYQPELITQTKRFKRLAKTSCLKTWADAVESNVVSITVKTNKWKGTEDNNWNNAENWTQNIVPSSDADIVFDDAPLHECVLDQDRSVNNITINQPAFQLITNGNSLTIKGNINTSNGAHIDCSSPNSSILFSGTTFQIIPSDAFVNQKVFSLIIDNVFGTSLSSDLTIEHLLTINPGSQLIVPTETVLNVEGKINNLAGVTGLIIKADPKGDAPNGSLIFHNELDQNPSVLATVEMFTKASQINGSYRWQFFGIPLKSIQANPTFSGSYVREMHENVTGTTNHWEQLQNESVLTSFTGYEITQKESKTIYFEGELVNKDYGPVQLSYTPDATYTGQHLIGNPYTAAINIKNDEIPANSLTFGGGVDKTVYLYNTGSKAEWSGNGLNGGGNSDAPGQYLSVPQENAGTDLIPATVPSMQAFLVMVKSPGTTATISIPYSSTGTIVKNTSPQRISVAKKVFTRIDITGSYSGDRMWLFTDSTCSRGFDNGWDGYKIIGSSLAPQIYASEIDADYQVNTINDINNTYIGFKAGIDTIYTLTFTHQNMDTRYRNIYLMDLSENKTVEITTSGSLYSFNSNSGIPLEKRFKIVASPLDGITTDYKTTEEKNNPLSVFSSNHFIIVKNRSNLKGNLYLYDMTGRFIQRFAFNANDITTFSVTLPAGIYLSKAVTLTEEVTTNLILKE